jgi:LysM repeat protein/ABC-type branched-subunit amino acid transport system substrate-binding protein
MFAVTVLSQNGKSVITIVEHGNLFYLHEVMPKQTVYGLSKLYSVSMDLIFAHNPLSENGIKVGDKIKIIASPYKVEPYAVQRGESINSIARKNGMEERELLDMNPQTGDRLSIGQIIFIPIITSINDEVTSTISSAKGKDRSKSRQDGQVSDVVALPVNRVVETENQPRPSTETLPKRDTLTHIVTKGETLYGIARKYGVTVEYIQESNFLPNISINAGDKLIIITPELSAKQGSNTVQPIVEGIKKSEYNVYLFIPLYADQARDMNPLAIKRLEDYKNINSFQFIQYYEAALIAAEDISAKYQGIKINLHVVDAANGLSERLHKLIENNTLENADLIIGPFFTDGWEILCQYASLQNIAIVNPFAAKPNHCQNTRIYNGSATSFYQAQAFGRYILEKYPASHIILTHYRSHSTDAEDQALATYRLALETVFAENGKSISLTEVDLKDNGFNAVKSALKSDCENFIFGFFHNEYGVTSFMQSLHATKLTHITLVAPVSWLNFDNIETEYFMEMKTHYVHQFFVDYKNPNVVRFIDNFREKYFIEPTLKQYAFQGYDLTYYFLSNLCQYGTAFGEGSNAEANPNLLSTRFDFVRTEANLLENQFVQIFKMRDYNFYDVRTDTQTTSKAPKK